MVSQGNTCPASNAFIRAALAEIHIAVPTKCRSATVPRVPVEKRLIVPTVRLSFCAYCPKLPVPDLQEAQDLRRLRNRQLPESLGNSPHPN